MSFVGWFFVGEFGIGVIVGEGLGCFFCRYLGFVWGYGCSSFKNFIRVSYWSRRWSRVDKCVGRFAGEGEESGRRGDG